MTITVLDANDNTPTFANVSYNVNLFTDMLPGETVLQVQTVNYTILKICSIVSYFYCIVLCIVLLYYIYGVRIFVCASTHGTSMCFSLPSCRRLTLMLVPMVRSPIGS